MLSLFDRKEGGLASLACNILSNRKLRSGSALTREARVGGEVVLPCAHEFAHGLLSTIRKTR
jgi:hypothetical protein